VLRVEKLDVNLGARQLVGGASFSINNGDKIALVGRNGAGKSSMLSVLMGDAAAALSFSGVIEAQGSVGFLPQDVDDEGLGMEPYGLYHVLSARGLDRIEHDLRVAQELVSKDPTTENIQHLVDLQDDFGHRGGYESESEIFRLAKGVGLDEDVLLAELSSLSGGQRRRLELVRVLYQKPETMILDEPTNHLDLKAKAWLMAELTAFAGALLVVSHDLALLDKSVTRVFNLENGKLEQFKGNYSAYLAFVEEDSARRFKASTMEEKEIKRLKELADSMRHSTASRAKTAQSLDSRVERMQSSRTEVRAATTKIKFKLPTPPRSGVTALEVDKLSVRYGELVVIPSLSLSLERGTRLVVIGRNGAGKSSLLRCLAGVQQATSGTIKLGHNVAMGYFAQEHEEIDYGTTVLGNLGDSILKEERERRAILGSFGLKDAHVNENPASLSGGERTKLSLAKIAAGNNNLLILDEPSNNLDPRSRAAVGEMLRHWSGTSILVSHDRAFVAAYHPSHALMLPERKFTYWKESMLELIELI
ncbi:unnamed protein product, partial [Acidithrix sp. C25]